MKEIKKYMPGFFLILLAYIYIASAQGAGTTTTTTTVDSCSLAVTLLNQDPYPAVPGEYVKVVFQISGVDSNSCTGAKFRLVPTYPFSLDGEDEVKILGGNTYIAGYNQNWLVGYKLKVSEDAVEGENDIDVRYSSSKNLNLDSYVQESFNITVHDSRTSFDAVIQEATSSSVSIAIANTGKYTANSVIVRIPEQDSFQVTGTNGQMVGNLASGDYTVVSFAVSSKATPRNMTSRNMTRGTAPPNFSSQSGQLKFEVYYTDNLGERRIVNMTLPLNANSGNSTAYGGNFSRRTTSSSSSWSIWYTVIIVAVVLIIIAVILKKYSRQIKNLLVKKNQNPNKLPDWIRNAKEKSK